MSDGESSTVQIITGRVWREKDEAAERVHILLSAPDDDTAVRRAAQSLQQEGFAEVEFEQIGEILEEPDEEPHASAYQGALEGEIAIIIVDDDEHNED
ncbi:transcriptional regulator [Notoacmeibacter ruber]|uniref:Transcriptional regulator n=1 Tax=Notoacmeibacter ruber TaxID=2670375 RepID=A0A3L7JBJ3_9HYPH|nr:transcriptional regulator [Notoacmeibacter ruber]RLQ87799.1 transcriptional regulator [Notoacmeibacter ruber]